MIPGLTCTQCCLKYRMLQVVASDEERFGADRAQQAQEQQPFLLDLQAGLLSGNTFRQFLSQRCGPNSPMTQICGHQAFAEAVSGMIRHVSSSSLL